MLISVVIPCYNSEHTITRVVELCVEEFEKMKNYQYEFVLVNDYSKDQTYKVIEELAKKYPFVKGINFAKNFGQHNAMMAGLRYAKGDFIVGMDDDLQTHPSQLPLIIGKMEEGYDVVFGVYKKREFSWLHNLRSAIAIGIVWRLVGRPKDVEASNYWIIRKYVRDEIIQYDSTNIYLSMLFFRTTSNVGNVEIEHFQREEGTSNYTFKKGFKIFISFINFTIAPLRLAAVLGVIFSLCGMIGAMAIIIRKLLDPSIVLGWTSLMCVMLICFGIMFLMMGIVGEYIGKIALNTNHTPQYVVRETVNTEEE